MNIETIKIICDLIDFQNFSRTAEKHGISQSAVSQQLAQLELLYKCQLIDRKKRPLKPTRAGELFYHAGKEIIDCYQRLDSELSNLTRSASRIVVAAIYSIGMHTLQPYVKQFMEKYPTVNLSVEYYGANQIYPQVLKGQADIGVVAVPSQDKNLIVYPFENEPLLLTCSHEHPMSKENEIDIHRLQGENFIAFEEGVPSRIFIDGILNKYKIKVRTIMEFDNVETIKRAVEINAGVSILPQPSIRTEVTSGSLKAIPFSNERFYRPTGIIVRKDRILSQHGRYLIELLGRKV